MRKSVLALSIALLASSATAMWLWRELHAEQARNNELRTRIQVEARRGEPLRNADVVSPAQQQAQIAAPVSTSPVRTESPTPHVRGTQEEWDAYQRRLMKNPKYREARRAERRVQLSDRRDDAIRLLGFTPDEADAVIEHWLDQEMRQHAEPAPVVDVSQEGLRQLRDKNDAVERERQSELRRILGEEKRARWQGYLESLPSRARVEQLRTQLTGADALREDQLEPLISALHTERAQYRRELSEFRDTLSWQGEARDTWQQYEQRQVELLKAANERAHVTAAWVLSRDQLRQFDALLQRDIDQAEARQRVSRVRSKLDQREPAGPAN